MRCCINRVGCLVRRNTALFLNNKMNILLSAASIPIIISLYAFFLRDFLMDMVFQIGVKEYLVSEFTDRLMFAGLLVVINTTTCFGIIQICVNDGAAGIRKDLLSAPISGFSLLSGYWIASTGVSFAFTSATALAGEFFFSYQYGNESFLTVAVYGRILGILLFSSCMNSGMLLCFAGKLKNTTTFSTFGNLYGTVLGFLAGAYLPYFFYPEWMKSALLWFPPAQITSILRRTYMSPLMAIIEQKEKPGLMNVLYQSFGIDLKLGGDILAVPSQWSILVIVLAVVLLYLWLAGNNFRSS